MSTPRIIDNNRDEITATLDGKEIRGWSYATDVERRTKMLAAREFCEGWYQATKRALAIIDEEYDEAPSGTYDNGGTMDGWQMACSRARSLIGGKDG
ncbi:hypothetical protein [Mesorhizobium sp. Z1-4]|uniref:hypothetical protein n=1 Tax=Mesorhizobium sp. Z1-4 TaxID=2448478 RepID=UPI000FD86022|nr:hypothetical protein [Mesorhizobium sp. Z1-4]